VNRKSDGKVMGVMGKKKWLLPLFLNIE